ncbi:hypothetical protein [Candidatus Stoquefichus massiliensis]|uniref:hypothetical protein n=1 Tax=Candidatus Stoquefichus massiliensis TaxID=1470350 RepID=UPI00048114BC|nr:hypothetical protein [Candidatus Stoquefichus massiliensis]
MYIYNPLKDLSYSELILDPDQSYHTSLDQQKLYFFFKNLKKPKDIDHIVGLYIEYLIEPYIYEQFPQFYHKFSPKIEECIVAQLNFGNANLYHDYSQKFFIVMFNATEDDILKAYLNLNHYFNKHPFEYHHHQCLIQLKCGAYFAQPGIHPYQLYISAKDQFDMIAHKEKSIISMNYFRLAR